VHIINLKKNILKFWIRRKTWCIRATKCIDQAEYVIYP